MKCILALVLGLSISAWAADEAPTGLAYKGINIQLGGFLASEIVNRSNNMASDIGTNFRAIPYANSTGSGMSEFRGTERQSRFSILAQGDTDFGVHMAGYYELDFLGTSPNSNANESNSYTVRTRNVYMTMDDDNSGFHLLTGQNWSLVTMNTKGISPRNEAIPTTIDAQYAVGFNWARQWQIRAVKDWRKVFWAAVSLENAQTLVAGTVDPLMGNSNSLSGAAFGGGTTFSFNKYPDVVAKFAYESGFGHFEAFVLARNFQSHYGGAGATAQTSKQNLWTEGVGLGATIPIVPQMFDLSLSGLTGKGMGRYGTSQLPDATFSNDGSLTPLNSTQYLAQLAYHAGHGWEVYATYGMESVAGNTFSSTSTFGYGDNVVATNAGCNIYGSAICAPNLKGTTQENVGFWWTFYKGSYGFTKLGAQYSHTLLSTFSDTAYIAPKATQDMYFASLRYYPF